MQRRAVRKATSVLLRLCLDLIRAHDGKTFGPPLSIQPKVGFTVKLHPSLHGCPSKPLIALRTSFGLSFELLVDTGRKMGDSGLSKWRSPAGDLVPPLEYQDSASAFSSLTGIISFPFPLSELFWQSYKYRGVSQIFSVEFSSHPLF